MRSLLGVLVLVLGVGGLGFWARGHNAHRIETFIEDHAGKAVGATTHPLAISVSGRDIHVAGIADDAAEKARILKDLDGVEGRRVVTEDLTVLPKVTPYLAAVDKAEGGALTASGSVPSEAARADLALGDAGAALALASGAPEGWLDLAKAGIAALGPLQSGRMELSDTALKVSGVALGPDEAAAVEAALAPVVAAGKGAVDLDLTLLDDGTPPVWGLDWSALGGASVSGKLPKGIDLAGIASALGLSSVAGEPAKALLGPEGDIGFLSGLKDWLGRIERLSMTVTPETRAADAEIQGDVDGEGLKTALEAAGLQPQIRIVAPEGANGATRVNAATGETERWMGGFWLAVPKIEVGLAGCQTAANSALEGTTINFVTGSDQLDASAVRAINSLAGFMARCAEEAGLKAEIGGHTDNVGDATANLDLSQRRAVAVVRELVSRGVPPAALMARGYGMTQPVADNSTDAGRAKNRRTTITWSE